MNPNKEHVHRVRSHIAFFRMCKDLERFGLIPEDDNDLDWFYDAFVEARAEARRRQAWDERYSR